jgi:rRNA processing protein Krr1/Pno1
MKDSFRPVSNTIPFELNGLSRTIYQIQELEQKHLKTLETIKTTTQCKIVTFFEEDQKIVIIGEEKSVQSSKRVIKEMFNIPFENDKSSDKAPSQSQVVLSIYLASKLKGKGNYRIIYLKDKLKVGITETSDSANITFSLTGSKANVEEAKQIMQIKEESIKLSPDSVKFFNDMNEYNYRRFFFDKNIVLFNLDEKTSTLFVIGGERAIQATKEAIEKSNVGAKHFKRRY